MTDLSRRKLISWGLAATAGVAGLSVAARIAQKYALIPPDHGGIYGFGATLKIGRASCRERVCAIV